MKIIIFQPAFPKYREDFFVRIFNYYDIRFKLYFSDSSLFKFEHDVSYSSWSVVLPRVVRIPFGFFWQKGCFSTSLSKGDIAVISGNPRYLNLAFQMFYYKVKGVKIVWWGHLWSSSSSNLRLLFRSLLMVQCDALLFYTDKEMSDYSSRVSSYLRKPLLFALNNGINVTSIVTYRSPYFSSAREKSLLFIGRLTVKAHLELALHAISQLDTFTRPSLHVIGDGIQKEYLVNLSLSLGISNVVTWHGSLSDESLIANIANRCMAFVYPGEVGLSLIHGMAYGLPAIVHSNRWKHMPEIAAFTAGETGVDFEPGNAISLANEIDFLLRSPELLNNYSARATELADNVYNTDRMAQRFISMIEDLKPQ